MRRAWRKCRAGLSQEVITPSDEPEVRRRARIRLELAVNYFEMGKATVALDEVKQSLANDPPMLMPTIYAA